MVVVNDYIVFTPTNIFSEQCSFWSEIIPGVISLCCKTFQENIVVMYTRSVFYPHITGRGYMNTLLEIEQKLKYLELRKYHVRRTVKLSATFSSYFMLLHELLKSSLCKKT